ncbi:hypothetical protein GCM10008957_48530 [Deinococcus ruber]|uniref:Uncharacterized protein n=1 Tax=Deinococcus ruber TaxID=1848197 RepID=A0A918CMM1_9DEIO|nr:hypothetical protein GCM10008957_48530 [Deinococcus ruber]
MWPNSMLGSLKHELACLRRGQETDLVSANHCLCALWEDSILTIRAYTWASYKDEMGRLSTNL